MSDTPSRSGSYVPALDGFRGLGVAFVVLFHVGVLKGGWLGVDLFFVLSGFLITRLLVTERATTGRISLRNFWARRARRLLPALIMAMAGVTLYAWWYPEKTLLPTDLPRQMLGALFYFSNWLQLATSGGYWDRFSTPSPMKHLWSLSIEEQFYMLFPLVMLVVFAVVRRRARIAWILGAMAVASWATGLILLATGSGFERVYLGTDTRVGAVLCGCTLGYLACSPAHRISMTKVARVLSVPAMIGVVVAMVVVAGDTNWPTVEWLLMPAFELAVVVLLIVAIDVERPSITNAVATLPPLRWLGTISYGLYLWHFPICLAFDRAMRHSSRWLVVPVEIAASIVVAAASYRFVEEPIRRQRVHLPRLVPIIAVGAILALSFFSLDQSSAVASAHRADVERGAFDNVVAAPDDGAATGAATDDTSTTVVGIDPVTTTAPASSSSSTSSSAPGSTVPVVTTPTVRPTIPLTAPTGRSPRVLLIGDSVALFLNRALQADQKKLGVIASGTGGPGCGVGGVAQIAGASPIPKPALVKSCKKWHDGFADLVQKAKPDVVLLAFGAIQRYTMRLGGVDYQPCDRQYGDWYEDLMSKEIALLNRTGAPVAVMPMSYSRFGGTATTDDSIDCINAATARAVDRQLAGFILPIDKWTCPTRSTCKDEVNGVVLRPDGLHFEGAGASVAMRWVIGIIYGR